jgi:hypothetical protein
MFRRLQARCYQFYLYNIMEDEMRIRKIIGVIIICLAISIPAFAQPQGGPPGGSPGEAPQGDQAAATLDMTPVYEAMDVNKDGLVNKDEWLGSGMTQDSYDKLFSLMLDTDKDGNLTKDDIMGAIPRFEVDTDGDGKASIEGFVEAIKQAAASMAGGGQGGPPGGGPPEGAPPAGGPPAGASPGGAPAEIVGAFEAVLTLPKASPTAILTFCAGGEPFQGAWLEEGGNKVVGEMFDKEVNANELSFKIQAGPGLWEFACHIEGDKLIGTVTGDGATSPFEGKLVELEKEYCSK